MASIRAGRRRNDQPFVTPAKSEKPKAQSRKNLKYAPKDFERVLGMMRKHKATLRQACRDKGLPGEATVLAYAESNPSFRGKLLETYHALPYAVQARADMFSPRFFEEVRRLKSRGLSNREIGEKLGGVCEDGGEASQGNRGVRITGESLRGGLTVRVGEEHGAQIDFVSKSKAGGEHLMLVITNSKWKPIYGDSERDFETLSRTVMHKSGVLNNVGKPADSYMVFGWRNVRLGQQIMLSVVKDYYQIGLRSCRGETGRLSTAGSGNCVFLCHKLEKISPQIK